MSSRKYELCVKCFCVVGPDHEGTCDCGLRQHRPKRVTAYDTRDVDPLVEAVGSLLTAAAFLSLRDELGHDKRSMNEGWELLRVAAEETDALLASFGDQQEESK